MPVLAERPVYLLSFMVNISSDGHIVKFSMIHNLVEGKDHCSHAASFGTRKEHLYSSSWFSLLNMAFDLIQI